MQQRVMKEIRGDAISARDGRIGSVKDVYFDDERWAVRYLVVDTGKWLPGRKVLISPASLAPAADDDDAIAANLTREQIEGAPGIDADKPVSRLYEEAHAQYFKYPYYWTGPYLWGHAPVPTPALMAQASEEGAESPAAREESARAEARAAESHLRSTAEVVGYRIQASDGPLGHVEDLLVDNDNWAIDKMIVDTKEWLPGGHVLVSPSAVEGIDWHAREVRLRLTRAELRAASEAH